MYLNSLIYLRSFANSYRWFTHTSLIFNSYGGSFKILFHGYHINSFVVPILPVVRWRPSQVDAISILILSTRISGVPNPLFCHQFNWWRIKHNVILILVSSSLLNFSSGVVHRITFSVEMLIFSFPEFHVFRIISSRRSI